MKAGLLIVTEPKMADLMLVINRPLLTCDFTFTLTDPQATMVFASGKVTAIDGRAAAPKIAKAFADHLEALRAARGEDKRKD
jgi:hypothetical protein